MPSFRALDIGLCADIYVSKKIVLSVSTRQISAYLKETNDFFLDD